MVKYQALDRTLAAIADPTRRSIVDRLSRGPASMSELAQPLGLSLPGLMKHVWILEEAELVTTRKEGRTRECRLAPARLDEVASWVEESRRRWEGRLDRLEAYVAKQKQKEKGEQG